MTDAILVIDLETTGFDPATEEIIEFAGESLLLDQRDFDGPGHDGFSFSSLTLPRIPIPAASSAIHHLTDWHVADAPQLGDLLSGLEHDFKAHTIWAAHNAKFEEGFLNPHLIPRGIAPQWICTYKCAVQLWPELPTHSNGGLFYALGIFGENPRAWSDWTATHQLHRAGPDAHITAKILKRILKKISVEDALRISSQPVLLPRVTFGKHRGLPWSDMDIGFLEWVIDRDFGEDVIHTARHWRNALRDEGDAS